VVGPLGVEAELMSLGEGVELRGLVEAGEEMRVAQVVVGYLRHHPGEDGRSYRR